MPNVPLQPVFNHTERRTKIVKTATFPAVIEAKKIAMKQLEYYQTMMAGAQAPAEGVLLPCPCCGSDANFHQVEVKENADYGGQYIECECCGLSTNMRFAWGDDPKPLLAEAWNRRSTPAEGALTLDQALRRAFILGQTYWQQADSDSYSQNRKSDETRQKFETLVSSMLSTPAGQAPAPEPLASLTWLEKAAREVRNTVLVDREVDVLRARLATPQPVQEPAEGAAREVKNRLCIEGHLNRAMNAISSTREPDVVSTILTGLAHLAVDMAFAAPKE
jgi:hypothetical protein